MARKAGYPPNNLTDNTLHILTLSRVQPHQGSVYMLGMGFEKPGPPVAL